jgi:serine/threonine protein kinase
VASLCLPDDNIVAFVAGALAAADHRAAADHLDRCALCRRLVSEAAAVESDPADDAGDGEVRAGERIDRFVLTRRLGHGAMGEVWAARDQELEREVALKLLRLRGEVLGTEASARLRREAQAMARLNHPNVVAIYELGADRGRVFCAMELVDGTTLRRWLAAPRSWREVVRVAAAAGRGIAAAHAVGLVHRDIKPENVLIAADGSALISDFGLAKLADLGLDAYERVRGDTAAGEMTATGAMVGTPVYMAPEQLAGAPADARSDQFAYCVTVYEALFGHRPFAGDSVAALAEAIARGVPRRRGAVPEGVARAGRR